MQHNNIITVIILMFAERIWHYGVVSVGLLICLSCWLSVRMKNREPTDKILMLWHEYENGELRSDIMCCNLTLTVDLESYFGISISSDTHLCQRYQRAT